MELLRTKENLAENGMGWTVDFSIPLVKSIGAREILAVLGLILPALFDVAPFVVPLAALGLVLLMVGAAATHARRREGLMIVVNSVLVFRCRGRAVGPPRPRLLQPMITKGLGTR
jgi:DoxX-like family